MEVHQLRYFVAAAESGSISAAARRCHVAQPSLSQQVRRLEAQLGQVLFDRVGRGVVLTDAGRALLPRARRILREIEDAESHLAGAHWDDDVRLAIGAIPTMAPYLLPDVLVALRAAYPNGEFLIREDFTESLIDAVAAHELDVALVSTPIDDTRIELDVIGREALLVVVPRRHPLRGAASIGVADLRDEPAVALHEMHCLGRQITEFCTRRRIHRPIVCRTAQLATVLELVRRDLGVSVVPAMAAAHDSGRGVAFLPMKGEPPQRDLALAWRAGRTRSGAGERFAALMREQLASSAP